MSSAPKIHGGAPVFMVKDILAATAHYRDVLGFKIEFIYGEPPFYAGVERDNLLIHLSARKTERKPGQGAINVFVTGVDELYEELKKRGAKILKPPADYDYGMRDFDVLDLDGNDLCFGQESQNAGQK